VWLIAITLAPGGRLIAVGEHGVIIYSDDAGLHWAQAAVPVNVTLTCVTFATRSMGWAAGHYGVVLNTLDGGQSWHMQLNGIEANQLTMQAAQALAVASSPSPAAPLAEKRAERFMAEGPDKPFLCILSQNPQRLFAFGAYRLTMMSDDAGSTWQDWSLHIYDKYSHNLYGTAVIGGYLYVTSEMGFIFCSKDNGDTFLPLPSPANVTLFGILGTHDGSLIAYGVAGSVFRSVDGGNSWDNVNLSTQQDITSGRVLRSGAVVLVDGSGALFQSNDNGSTFKSPNETQHVPLFDFQEVIDGSLVGVGAVGVTRFSLSV
jgi:photosystem II stability/assembly factor-like uncharacterized protein